MRAPREHQIRTREAPGERRGANESTRKAQEAHGEPRESTRRAQENPRDHQGFCQGWRPCHHRRLHILLPIIEAFASRAVATIMVNTTNVNVIADSNTDMSTVL